MLIFIKLKFILFRKIILYEKIEKLEQESKSKDVVISQLQEHVLSVETELPAAIMNKNENAVTHRSQIQRRQCKS